MVIGLSGVSLSMLTIGLAFLSKEQRMLQELAHSDFYGHVPWIGVGAIQQQPVPTNALSQLDVPVPTWAVEEPTPPFALVTQGAFRVEWQNCTGGVLVPEYGNFARNKSNCTVLTPLMDWNGSLTTWNNSDAQQTYQQVEDCMLFAYNGSSILNSNRTLKLVGNTRTCELFHPTYDDRMQMRYKFREYKKMGVQSRFHIRVDAVVMTVLTIVAFVGWRYKSRAVRDRHTPVQLELSDSDRHAALVVA